MANAINPDESMTSPSLPAIGTPLSAAATRVMLLGAGELGKEVLIALQRLGVETIAVDRYENAPGQQVAHHARTIAMSDAQQLKALIEAERPDVVVPEIEAIATPMLEELEAAGVVRVIPTARAARLTMNREGIRRLAAETLGSADESVQSSAIRLTSCRPRSTASRHHGLRALGSCRPARPLAIHASSSRS